MFLDPVKVCQFVRSITYNLSSVARQLGAIIQVINGFVVRQAGLHGADKQSRADEESVVSISNDDSSGPNSS